MRDRLITAAALKDLKHLAVLDLSQFERTPDLLKDLQSLKNLVDLDIADPKLTDAAVAEIAKIGTLRAVRLNGPITDAGLQELRNLKNLNRSAWSAPASATPECRNWPRCRIWCGSIFTRRR